MMVNLNAALDQCGIEMREAFVPERLGETMDEYFASTLEKHQGSLDAASLYLRERDVAGLVNAADKVLSESTGKTAQTCVDCNDGLIFFGCNVMIINENTCRDVPSWCRIFNKNASRMCCVCRENQPRRSICSVCHANCCHACDSRLESANCPVCRAKKQFTLSAK